MPSWEMCAEARSRSKRAGAAALLQWRYGLWNGNVKAEYVREDDIFNARSREKTAIFVTVTRKLWQ